MNVGPTSLLDKNDTDDNPEEQIDNCWEYQNILLSIPFPGSDGYIP